MDDTISTVAESPEFKLLLRLVRDLDLFTSSVAEVTAVIRTLVSEIDDKLGAQVNVILHHRRFQQLESSWRGLQYLINNSDTERGFRIRVLDISRADLTNALILDLDAVWDENPVLKHVRDNTFGTPGGEPFGCLVGDYHFDHSSQDMALLSHMARVAAKIHAPFLAGASARLMGVESWYDLKDCAIPADISSSDEYSSWNSFRSSENAKYIALAMPRFLARIPNDNDTSEFAFKESAGVDAPGMYTWLNAAYAMAVNIGGSFSDYHWFNALCGFGSASAKSGMPVHVLSRNRRGKVSVGPTEYIFDAREAKTFASLGLLPLRGNSRRGTAAFVNAQTLHSPPVRTGSSAASTSHSKVAARLPHLLAGFRFAHFLKCMVRDRFLAFREDGEIERQLSEWIQEYVLAWPQLAADEMQARQPLSAVQLSVRQLEGTPDARVVDLTMRTHRLLSAKVPMHVAFSIPS